MTKSIPLEHRPLSHGVMAVPEAMPIAFFAKAPPHMRQEYVRIAAKLTAYWEPGRVLGELTVDHVIDEEGLESIVWASAKHRGSL